MILPTYVELVWGCSNASFGILRPGFRFLPVRKEIAKSYGLNHTQQERRHRDCDRRKWAPWVLSSHLPFRTALSSWGAYGWWNQSKQKQDSQTLTGHPAGCISPIQVGNIEIMSTFFLLQRSAFSPGSFQYISFSFCRIRVTAFVFFGTSEDYNHLYISIPPFSNSVCEQLLELKKEIEIFFFNFSPLFHPTHYSNTCHKLRATIILIYICLVPKKILRTDGLP